MHLAQEAVPEDAMKEELMDSLSKGNFTMRILYEQLANIQKMGPVGQVMGMIPGLSNSGLFTKVCHAFPHNIQGIAKSSRRLRPSLCFLSFWPWCQFPLHCCWSVPHFWIFYPPGPGCHRHVKLSSWPAVCV